MNFYTRIAATVDRVLKDKGQLVTITRKTSGTYDPATGEASVTTTTQQGYAVLAKWNSESIDGSLIQATDNRLLLSPDGISAPMLNDTVTIGSVTSTVVEPLKTISPAGTVVVYDLNLRA